MTKKMIKTVSVSYVHDPEAAEKWFQIYMDLLLDEMKKDKLSIEASYNET
ncbi:hypothetical protein [Bacillus aerolatus]|nr:hypothetical protein [Bacillus aerolatus]